MLWLSVFWCFSVFCLSSSRCIGLVCGLRVWHFPFIGTCFLDGTNYITECNLGKVSFIVLLNPYSDIYNLQQITISNFAAFSKKKKKKKKKIRHDVSWESSACIPYFYRKLGKMAQKLSSAAVVIGALRVNSFKVSKGAKIRNRYNQPIHTHLRRMRFLCQRYINLSIFISYK